MRTISSFCIAVFVFLAWYAVSASAADTVYIDNGVASSTVSTDRNGWEESVILSPTRPVKLTKLLVRYARLGSADTIRITGDAAEGTIPPTQYCYSYNTLATVVLAPSSTSEWTWVDLSAYNIVVGGFDRIVVQHIMRTGAPIWAVDANGQAGTTSFLYDPTTPNPNFGNLPGIYYLATSDFMVRLEVENLYPFRPAPQFSEVSRAMGLVNADGSAIRADMASVADWNNDGWDDIAVNGMFFTNDSGKRFTRISMPMGMGPTAWADVDNDGDLDCFVAAGNGNDKLWRNNNGAFADVTSASNITNNAPTVTALWFDMDHDGDLDLFIANGRREVSGQETYFQDKLWRNDGNLTFTDVTSASGIAAGEPPPYFDTWGATLCDFNNDGYTDIFVATYRLAPDRLYRNNKDGTFTEVSAQTGANGIPTSVPQYFGHGMGSDWADIDNDGDADLAVGNLGHPDSRAQYSNPSLILRNTGTAQSPVFRNWYAAAPNGGITYHGVKFREMNAGMCFLDLNHDGNQDLWHGQISYEAYRAGADRPAHLYMGSGESATPFVDVAWEKGLFIHGAWTAVRLDVDNDGDLDLLCLSGTENLKLFLNNMEKTGRSVSFTLNDQRPTGNRRGYGARVVTHAGGRQFTRWLPGTTSSGRMAQMSEIIHVGVGTSNIDSVVVFWADGLRTQHTNITYHNRYELSSNGSTLASASLPAVPMSPARGAVLLTNPVTVRWSVATGTSCDVRVATNVGMTDASVAAGITADSLVLNLGSSGTTVFWQVRVSASTEWSDVWNYTLGYPKPTPPVPVSPVADAENVPTKTTLLWHPSANLYGVQLPVIYDVRISRDRAMTDPVADVRGISDTSTVVDGLPKLSTLHWSVRARNQWQDGAWSASTAFTTYDTPFPLGLVYPANNAVNVEIRPRFMWERMPFTDMGYEVEVDTIATFETVLRRKASDTALTITPALKPNRQYWWRVRGVNHAGEGSYTSVSTFRTASTTSVRETSTNELPAWVEIYDVLGRTCASGVYADRDHLISSCSGVLIVLYKDDRGNIVRHSTLLR